MSKLFLIIFLLLSLPAYSKGVLHPITVTRYIDGDTVAFEATWLPDPLKKELSIRVYGVDTPEKGHRAKCESESLKGQAASQYTRDIISRAAKIEMELISWDKYGGRVLGDIIVDGQSLRALLIKEGYAREYYGEAKESWCN